MLGGPPQSKRHLAPPSHQQEQHDPHFKQLLDQDEDENSERDVPAQTEGSGARQSCAHADPKTWPGGTQAGTFSQAYSAALYSQSGGIGNGRFTSRHLDFKSLQFNLFVLGVGVIVRSVVGLLPYFMLQDLIRHRENIKDLVCVILEVRIIRGERIWRAIHYEAGGVKHVFRVEHVAL